MKKFVIIYLENKGFRKEVVILMAKQNNGNHVVTSEMYCTECGKRNIPISRKIGQMREPGHLKKMYCIHCQKETNMVEIRPYGNRYSLEWFMLEYEMGNFKDGKRVIPLSKFKQKMNNRMESDNYGE